MKTFSELPLIPAIQKALTEEGYQTPTPIQAKTLPPALDGQDVLGCAQTGTGKTAAFALPILNWLAETPTRSLPQRPFALVLAPTRELAIQIAESFRTYGQHCRLRIATIYGGVNQRQQVRALERGAHILVATPGRLLDLMNQQHVRLSELEVFVLDEADRMLDMGFLPDLKRIIRALPEERQSLFFSATLAPKIKQLAQRLLYDPVQVDVTPKSSSVAQIEQSVMRVTRRDKPAVLRHIVGAPEADRVIVFTKTKRGANRVSEKLNRQGIQASAIHGNKSQSARQKALTGFRDAQIKVLVATDVAARGIDIDGVTHVVNYDIPHPPESYVHRIGRTGRAGATGVAVSLCSPEEFGELRAIEQLIGKQVPVTQSPRVEPADETRPPSGPRHGGQQRRGRPSQPKAKRPARSKQRRRRRPAAAVAAS